MSALRVILYEGDNSRPLPAEQRAALVQGLLEKGYSVARVRENRTLELNEESTLFILGRFDGAPPELAGMQFCNLDEFDTAAAIQEVERFRTETQRPQPGAWKPWFPVIDYKRCTNCMQCLSFCLFDVYGVSADGKIQVRTQQNCKTDCPACSRVCPEVAIMFPKYRHGPINGEEVSTDDVRREVMKVDISSLLGGNIYEALRDRSAKAKSRFSKERDDDRALKERQNCLLKLQEQLDIPAEVFAALPSIEEIQKKAEAAQAKARQATGAGQGA